MSAARHTANICTDQGIVKQAVPPKNPQAPSSPAGTVPNPFTYKLSHAPSLPLAGGSWKVFDTSVFPVAKTIVGAIVTVEPGAMRYAHDPFFSSNRLLKKLFRLGNYMCVLISEIEYRDCTHPASVASN